MNKYVAVLAIVVILLSAVCGFLSIQIADLQNRNCRLYDEKIAFRDMILEYQNLTAQLKSQISDLYFQISELQNQLGEQEAEHTLELSNAYQVKITGMSTEYGPFVSRYNVGAPVPEWFKVTVTVENSGIHDVKNLRVRMEWKFYKYALPRLEYIVLLEGGEEREVTFTVDYSLYYPPFVFNLMFEDIVLDTLDMSKQYY